MLETIWEGHVVKQVSAANYLGILDKCLKQCGIDNFLKDIGFEKIDVNDPAAYLNFDEFTFILHAAYQRSQCPHLGLLFGEQLSIVNHGFLGYAAMTSPTLRTAIQTFLNFVMIRTSLLQGTLRAEGPATACIELKILTTEPLISRFITEMAIVHLAKLRVFLINASTPFLKIEIAYDDPLYEHYYQQLLHTDIKFNAEVTRIWLPRSELDYPISFADDASYQQAKKQLHTLAKQMTVADELPQRIKKILYHQDEYRLTMPQVASKLCISSRTLRRHLQKHDVTYQALFDEVRCQKAKELLLINHLSMTEISFLLGFHDSSNFSKAFKRWTGLSPTAYRSRK